MLNAEKFKDEILETLDCDCEGFGVTEDNKIIGCVNNCCCICQFCRKHYCDYVAKARWLLSEYKESIKLTRLEYDILKYLSDNTRHVYIVRDGNGNIFLYDEEPQKSESSPWWTGRGMCHMNMFNELFQFVKWEDEEPTSIEEVLKNCVVEED